MIGNGHVRFGGGPTEQGRWQAGTSLAAYPTLTALAWRLPAWSPCGTNVPVERLGFLARAHTIYGVFDGDAEGRAASERFAVLLGKRWRPVALPEGHDWNDLARQPNGRTEFFRLLGTARRIDVEGKSDGRTPDQDS